MKQQVSVLFMLLAVVFVVCLITANLLETKVLNFFNITTITAGMLVFPLSYIINDCIAEVWGFRRITLVIWTGFAMNIFFGSSRPVGCYTTCSTILGWRRAFQLHIRTDAPNSFCQPTGILAWLVYQCIHYEQDEGCAQRPAFLSACSAFHFCWGNRRLHNILSDSLWRTYCIT